MQTSCQTTLKGDNMQAINPNMNIGFRQNQTDKNIKKKTLLLSVFRRITLWDKNRVVMRK